jgi:hypothetical protein
MRWAGNVAQIGRKKKTKKKKKKRNAYRILVGRPKVKKPLRRPRRWCVDNIEMDLREIGSGCMDWILLAQDRDQ